jgi:hypothetical protein
MREIAAILFDHEITTFWEGMNRAWQAGLARDIPLVSISGGYKDDLVPSHLTRLPLTDEIDEMISVDAAQVQGVWTDADHLCIVWCNQLVRSVLFTLPVDCAESYPACYSIVS